MRVSLWGRRGSSADAPDLGSGGLVPWGFESPLSHQSESFFLESLQGERSERAASFDLFRQTEGQVPRRLDERIQRVKVHHGAEG